VTGSAKSSVTGSGEELRDRLGEELRDRLGEELRDRLGEELRDRLGDRHGSFTAPRRLRYGYPSAVSSQIVNGPSFTSSTAISAPNRPVATGTPISASAAANRR
jgi:hypothetical protein